jgi:solute carrier family 25 (mitochondrial phosphate transporter), member 3
MIPLSLSFSLPPSPPSGRILTFMISGFFAESIGSTFLSPFEAARIRLVTNPSYARGVVDCIKRIVAEEQLSSLFRGLPAVFAKQIPFTVIQLASFESITTAIYSYLSRSDNNFDFNEVAQYKYAISASSALVAAVLSSLASQPGDTLLSAVNQSSKKAFLEGPPNGSEARIEGIDIVTLQNPIEVMRDTIDEVGLKGLFKGTKARLLHVSFYVVVQFLVYDFVKQAVGLPVTGAH